MNSNFLNMIGLGSVDIGYLLLTLLIINVILLILIILAFLQINKFTKKYKKFMQGKNASSLEKDIMSLYEDNTFIKANVEKNKKDIAELFEKHKTTFQKMGLVKYDAFKEMGGKLSFTLALLDENNNGVLLNSVHSSDGCYSYTKRIKNGDSAITLSNEEKVAVERAMQGTASNPDAE
ncbi:MAG: DUF4446 family protein [Lachnospiraceae bacterium]|nr:DUF4446 family protein [Lachnospiraceae bacterium]